MNRMEQLMIGVPVVLSLAAVWASYDHMQRVRNDAEASSQSLAEVENAVEAIRLLRARLDDSKKLAPATYDPSSVVVQAFQAAEIPRPTGFAVRRQNPVPLPGSPYARVDIGLPQIEMSIPELIRLVKALLESPVQHQSESVTLRPTGRATESDEERWIVELRAGYLVLASDLPSTSTSRSRR